jgi:hypothetical protein
MWYNQELQERAEVQYIFPDGRVLDASNADKSPVDGWEWHTEPPEWWPKETTDDITEDGHQLE